MSSQDDLKNMLNSIAGDLDNLIGASVVDLDTGMTLATVSRSTDFDLEVASAFDSEVLKSKLKAIYALNLDSQLEDMLLTLSDQLHLIRPLSESEFLFVATSRRSTNLAMLRAVVNRRIGALGH
ncbi:hypothetical protein ACUY3K_06055 [Corynebacterium uberis]|uniref:hypothetical protein n=1 Tax=Corynebacterium TaxID=1716 RepID=UPI001D0A9C81|nr:MULTISPECIES: hypothetical protein [Corynebacterium]MCZ9308256.1 hypothetical protein [Corynebacterium sp. c6VSa_13]UDL73936.1 hypothetical protein LH391_01525 [Corynebacterium uberis]UDL75181.1 hypothetical protein LH393_07890 [Corynebacterium uberis]UDL77392.1 hypothetical protein LH394_07870 [Corynebacterium uberis]UDL79677.1 hypothetical protein LH392_08295 [Corynebacterium uberis]